jgi:hypothetical protein
MEAANLYLIGTGIQSGANAAGLERQAAEEFAAGQRAAGERRRNTDLVISRQRALAAASGAGAGPSLLDIIGDTAGRGEYQAQSEMFLGESRARNLKNRAAAARYEGENAFIGSILEGVGNVALGAGRYGGIYAPSARPRASGPWRTTVSYG